MTCSRRWDWRLSYLDVTPFSLENSVSTLRRNLLTPSSGQNSNIVRRGNRFSVIRTPTTNLHDVAFQTTLIFRKNSCSCHQPVRLHLMQRVFRELLTYGCIYCRCYCVCVCVCVEGAGGLEARPRLRISLIHIQTPQTGQYAKMNIYMSRLYDPT